MVEVPGPSDSIAGYGQLTQIRVPLGEATEAFTYPRADGRVPIIVIPQRVYRYLNSVVISALVLAIAVLLRATLLQTDLLTPLGIGIAVILLSLGILPWFYVQIPEGVSALLARGGRYQRTIGSGAHFLPPYIAITHLVTQRDIPFDVPISDALTSDNVRAHADVLVTLAIAEPVRFVYQISASDFDQVLQAACQESLRSLIRSISTDGLSDLVGRDAAEPREQMEEIVASYGATIRRLIVAHVHLPAEFLRTLEDRQLAVLLKAEQVEKHALDVRRQADTDELARQQILARDERERETLSAQLRLVEERRRLVMEEAAIEAERLARLDERLRHSPLAAWWEREGARLDVARSLAGNTRAIVQIGAADDIARALAMGEALYDVREPGEGENGSADTVEGAGQQPPQQQPA